MRDALIKTVTLLAAQTAVVLIYSAAFVGQANAADLQTAMFSSGWQHCTGSTEEFDSNVVSTWSPAPAPGTITVVGADFEAYTPGGADVYYLVVKTSTQALILTAAEGEKHARIFFPSGTGFVLGPSDYARLFVACGPIGATFAVDGITYYTQPQHSNERE